MAARIVDIADRIVTLLNPPTTWTQSFTATRKYSVEYDLQELETLRVDVQVVAQIDEEADRDEDQETAYGVAIAVQKHVDPSDNAEIDPLIALVLEIADYFHAGEEITATTPLKITEVRKVLYTPKELDVNERFYGLVTLTLREWRTP